MIVDYPFAFYLAAAVLIGLFVEAFWKFSRAWALPALAVYGTTGAWYLGNLVQIGPTEFGDIFDDRTVSFALQQVILFLLAYRVIIHFLLPQSLDPQAGISVTSRLDPSALARFFIVLCGLWLALFVAGLATADWEILPVLWPPLSPEKIGMFGHSGIGAGNDFLKAAGGYVYRLICTVFGVLFVLSRGSTRWLSLIMVIITWPYFWFDRARNVMLSLILPAVVCYWIASHGEWAKKILVSLLVFGFVNVWFLSVMQTRDRENASSTMLESLFQDRGSDEKTQLGLDMLQELCWMDLFIDNGYYTPNWGERYLAELANAVPRTFWANKPTIGIDYAILRGFGVEEGGVGNEAGVNATVSTGMIGQGVANFGPIFGVIAAAFLMALWTKLLAILWARRFELLRFLLFAVGCGLTFNMGRDITLLVLWPFVFGYIGVVVFEKLNAGRAHATIATPEAEQNVNP